MAESDSGVDRTDVSPRPDSQTDFTSCFSLIPINTVFVRRKNRVEDAGVINGVLFGETRKDLLIPPEGMTIAAPLLGRFSPLAFELHSSVVPLCIDVDSPFNLSSESPNKWVDLLLSLAVPFARYRVKVLPPVWQQENESSVEFANRVQHYMARENNLIATQFSRRDKERWQNQILEHEIPIDRATAHTQRHGLGR